MPEKAIETSNVDIPEKSLLSFGLTVWVDSQTVHDLDLIATFERDQRGPVMRRILIEKIRVYQRNPAFKRFLKQLQRTQQELK